MSPGDRLLTKAGNGISVVIVTSTDPDGTVHYSWLGGAEGLVSEDDIGHLNETDSDYQFVRLP